MRGSVPTTARPSRTGDGTVAEDHAVHRRQPLPLGVGLASPPVSAVEAALRVRPRRHPPGGAPSSVLVSPIVGGGCGAFFDAVVEQGVRCGLGRGRRGLARGQGGADGRLRRACGPARLGRSPGRLPRRLPGRRQGRSLGPGWPRRSARAERRQQSGRGSRRPHTMAPEETHTRRSALGGGRELLKGAVPAPRQLAEKSELC